MLAGRMTSLGEKRSISPLITHNQRVQSLWANTVTTHGEIRDGSVWQGINICTASSLSLPFVSHSLARMHFLLLIPLFLCLLHSVPITPPPFPPPLSLSPSFLLQTPTHSLTHRSWQLASVFALLVEQCWEPLRPRAGVNLPACRKEPTGAHKELKDTCQHGFRLEYHLGQHGDTSKSPCTLRAAAH